MIICVGLIKLKENKIILHQENLPQHVDFIAPVDQPDKRSRIMRKLLLTHLSAAPFRLFRIHIQMGIQIASYL